MSEPNRSEETMEVPEGLRSSRPTLAKTQWEAELELNWHKAETERLKVLVDFLTNPVARNACDVECFHRPLPYQDFVSIGMAVFTHTWV